MQRITFVKDYINRKRDGFSCPKLVFFSWHSIKHYCCIHVMCGFPCVNPIKVNRILVLLLNKFQRGLTFEKYLTNRNAQNTIPYQHEYMVSKTEKLLWRHDAAVFCFICREKFVPWLYFKNICVFCCLFLLSLLLL